jgi:hypothetical protein
MSGSKILRVCWLSQKMRTSRRGSLHCCASFGCCGRTQVLISW